MGLVADPGFDDPAAWSTPGSSEVSGGKLVIELAAPEYNVVTPIPAFSGEVGRIYSYRVVVSEFDVPPGNPAGIVFGGDSIYSESGVGTFTGLVTPADTSTLQFIYDFPAGRWAIDSIEVNELHVRESIRNDVVATVTGLTTTGANVFATRIRPISDSSLPCLLVYTTEELINLEAGTLDAPHRALNVRVSGVVKANSSLDDTMDDIAEEVETALGADITSGGYAISLDLLSTTIELDGEAEKQVGVIHLDYIISYRTPFGDPTTVA